MLELLLVPTLTSTPIKNEALQTFEQHKIVEVVEVPPPPPELSVEDKIKLNFYNCDTNTQYIRADNAQCIDKPVSTQKANITAGNAPQGYYPKGQCTWWVSTKRPVGEWGDATEWKYHASREGYTISSTPVAGAIGWTYGHVVYAESVNDDGSVNISEANYDWKGSIRYITVPASKYTWIY